MPSPPAAAHVRSLYRRILRELPPQPKAITSTPLRNSIRAHFAAPSPNSSGEYLLARSQETEQAVQYLRAQRVYMTLLERYNPGMTMEDEERTRLTARRVGMEMPVEFKDLARDLEKNKKWRMGMIRGMPQLLKLDWVLDIVAKLAGIGEMSAPGCIAGTNTARLERLLCRSLLGKWTARAINFAVHSRITTGEVRLSHKGGF